MGSRRQAREFALMILYGMDLARTPAEAAIRGFLESFATGDVLDPVPGFITREPDRLEPPSSEVEAHLRRLVFGVSGNLEAIDLAITQTSAHWRLDRMSCVDRNLLRLSAFELLFLGDEIPRKVAINEAVEVAKRFGSKESSAFVNGLLDRLRA